MAATPDLTLWGVGTSRTIRPHWAMHELNLPYKTKPIGPRTGETKTAEYTRLNLRQKVPLLQDGDFRIGESAAIVAYLSSTYSSPERALIPEKQRARLSCTCSVGDDVVLDGEALVKVPAQATTARPLPKISDQ